MDVPRAILEGGQNVHIEVTTVGEDYTTPQYSPIVVFDSNGDEIRTIGSETGGYQAFVSEDHPNIARAGENEGSGDQQSDIFSSGPSSVAGDSQFGGSTALNDETISNASLPTVDADPEGPYEPEDFYPRGGNYINQDFIAINPAIYPGQDRQPGPDANGPIVTIVVGGFEINVHHNLLGYSQKFQGQYREGNAIRNRVRVTEDSQQAWKLIAMAMYSQEWHPTRTNFKAQNFVEAIVVARRWDFAGPVEHNLKEMMRRYFSYFAQWKGVHLNGLTADFHMTIMKEINDAFILTKSIAEPKPFPLTAFGLVLLKQCPPAVWTAYGSKMDPVLFKQVADVSIRDQNQVTFMSIETALLSSF
ncbi:hypothetical protein F5X99DRAFT_417077 [Biscogniauxia marginata]|nr:hypothetical protein F5X99DRAFT_417077 [Biscogniauxia marginata]